MVVVRKNISVEQGDQRLFDEIRYFFYLTNDHETAAADVVFLANDRCNQENLIDATQTGGRHADAGGHAAEQLGLHGDGRARVDAQGVVCVAAPRDGRWAGRYAAEKAAVLRMEFKAFLHAFMLVPVQVVRTSRRIVFRLLAWNPWQAVFSAGSISSARRCGCERPPETGIERPGCTDRLSCVRGGSANRQPSGVTAGAAPVGRCVAGRGSTLHAREPNPEHAYFGASHSISCPRSAGAG
jgi:hypothetical protein